MMRTFFRLTAGPTTKFYPAVTPETVQGRTNIRATITPRNPLVEARVNQRATAVAAMNSSSYQLFVIETLSAAAVRRTYA